MDNLNTDALRRLYCRASSKTTSSVCRSGKWRSANFSSSITTTLSQHPNLTHYLILPHNLSPTHSLKVFQTGVIVATVKQCQHKLKTSVVVPGQALPYHITPVSTACVRRKRTGHCNEVSGRCFCSRPSEEQWKFPSHCS